MSSAIPAENRNALEEDQRPSFSKFCASKTDNRLPIGADRRRPAAHWLLTGRQLVPTGSQLSVFEAQYFDIIGCSVGGGRGGSVGDGVPQNKGWPEYCTDLCMGALE